MSPALTRRRFDAAKLNTSDNIVCEHAGDSVLAEPSFSKSPLTTSLALCLSSSCDHHDHRVGRNEVPCGWRLQDVHGRKSIQFSHSLRLTARMPAFRFSSLLYTSSFCQAVMFFLVGVRLARKAAKARPCSWGRTLSLVTLSAHLHVVVVQNVPLLDLQE